MDQQRPSPQPARREQRRQALMARRKAHRRRMLAVFGSLTLILVLLVALLCHFCGGTEEPKKPDASTPSSDQPQTPIPSEPVVTPAKTATILAVGDNLMHEQIVVSSQNADGSYDFSGLFERMKPTFQGADLAILCQETILVENEEDTSNGLPYYGTTASLAPAVQAAGFDLVAHATEHSYDMGLEAVAFTEKTWNDLGVTPLGIHGTEESAEKIAIHEVNGIRIAFLNYTYADGDMLKAEEDYAVDYLQSTDPIARQITAAKSQADAVIVVAHWGEMTTYEANDFQKTWAQFFADNGVAAVIGSHPHTLQPVQTMTGSNGNQMPVFYSLGNYMTNMGSYYNMLGGMAQLTITKDANGTRVSAYSLTPLMQVVDTTDGYEYYTLPLSDYTEEMAETHNLDQTSPKDMEELYRSVFPQDVNVVLDGGTGNQPAPSDSQPSDPSGTDPSEPDPSEPDPSE